MKRFLITTALVAFTTTSAMADAHKAAGMNTDVQAHSVGDMTVSADTLMGKTVYIDSNGASNEMGLADITDVPDTWENVADVSDILIDNSGKMVSIVLDAGGFLGMGETEKTVSIDNLKFVTDADDTDDFFVLYTGNKQLLEETDDYDAAAMDQNGYRSATGVGTVATATSTAAGTEPNMAEASRPADRSTMSKATLANMTTDKLDGVRIYGADDKMIGEIGNMVLADDGKIADVIVDVGGFLGLGERPVAMKFSEIQLMQGEDGSVNGYVSMTEDQVESLPAWESDL